MYILFLLIFLLPLQTRWMFRLGELNGGYYEYGTMSLYFIDILLISLLVYSLTPTLSQRARGLGGRTLARFHQMRIWWIIAGLELFVFISIFSAFDKWLALYGYGRFLLGIGLFFLITQISYDKIKLYWVVVASGVVQSLLAMWQFAAQRVYASKWLGMAMQNSADSGVSVIETGDERWLRAYGSLPHPNMLGGFLVVCLLLNILLYFELHKKLIAAVDERIVRKCKLGLLLILLFFIVNFIGLLLTFSRGAWVGVFISLLIYLFINLLSEGKYRVENLFILSKFILIAVLLSGLFVWMLQEPVMSRFSIDSRLESKSIQERVDYNKDAWQVIKSHWLFGAGMSNYGLAVADEVRKDQPAYTYQPVHNTFLLVWAEVGIIGLLLFISLLIVTLLNCYIVKLLRCNCEAISLIVAIVVMMSFDHWSWSMGFGGMLFWLVIAVSYNRRHV